MGEACVQETEENRGREGRKEGSEGRRGESIAEIAGL